MSTEQLETQPAARPRIARIIHRLSVPIILGWLGIAVLISVAVPPLEKVAAEHAVSLSP